MVVIDHFLVPELSRETHKHPVTVELSYSMQHQPQMHKIYLEHFFCGLTGL